PTAMTPCADVQATATLGIMQVVTDPRTTLAQSLNAMLAAELIDNASWELLASLAEDAGETELAGRFLGALAQEQEHLAVVKGWVTLLVSEGAGSPAV
ncbi:MAG: ferritin Dps family protein, partial [Comamonadaceae bacterium]